MNLPLTEMEAAALHSELGVCLEYWKGEIKDSDDEGDRAMSQAHHDDLASIFKKLSKLLP